MAAGITGPAIVSITTQICGDAVSLVSSENLNQNWSDGTLIELSHPTGRVKSEKIEVHFPSEKHSAEIELFQDVWHNNGSLGRNLLWDAEIVV